MDAAASTRPLGENNNTDDDAVQLFARPSAAQLKRRQKQEQQQQQQRQDDDYSGLPSKRARSTAAAAEQHHVGGAPPSSAAITLHSPPIATTTTTNADSFEQLGVSSWLCSVLRTVGIARPTPVQAACIPAILAGRNAVGLAQTGSGKTAAFALPALQALSREGPYGVFCLVLTPTRELAFQLADQFRAFGAGMALRDAVVVGGLDARAQTAELARRPHVVVATPGRLAELLRQDASLAAGFARVRFLVLDEADRLLDASFEDALRVIVAALPRSKAGAAAAAAAAAAATNGGGKSAAAATTTAHAPACARQTLLFSATATRALLRLQEAALPDALVFSAYQAERQQQYQQQQKAAAAASGRLGGTKSLGKKKQKKKESKATEGQEEEEGSEEEDQGEDDQEEEEGAGGKQEGEPQQPPPLSSSLAGLAALDEAAAVALPEHLRQEYAFVPQRVKDVYLAHVLEGWLGVGAAAERLQQQQQQQQDHHHQRRNKGAKGAAAAATAAAAAATAAAARARGASGQGRSAIVFAGTCRGCRLLELLAGELGIQVAALHARKPQRQRLAALAAFRSGAVRLLVATDVAARGLDVPSVGLVVNYDLPALPRDYVHRVGRTARAGRSGRALSLVCPADVARLQAIEALTGRALAEAPELAGPEAEEGVLKGITRVFGARRAALMALGEEDDRLAETLERRRAGWQRGIGGDRGDRGDRGSSKKKKTKEEKRNKDKGGGDGTEKTSKAAAA